MLKQANYSEIKTDHLMLTKSEQKVYLRKYANCSWWRARFYF